MKHEHKSGAWFELPQDITQRQLEAYESETRRRLKDKEQETTDALLARAAIVSAFKAEIIQGSEGLPQAEKDLDEAPARLLWWMAREIATYIGSIKSLDPN